VHLALSFQMLPQHVSKCRGVLVVLLLRYFLALLHTMQIGINFVSVRELISNCGMDLFQC
jgi:hypothetical protein